MKRISIRILVSLIACAALAAFAWIPIPEDTNGHPVLPAVALEQAGLYRLEVALMVFYGGLLLITPAFSGLIEGRLPIEISARGARFADSTDEALDDLEKTAADLEGELSLLAADVKCLKLAIDDKTKPPVASD